MKILHIKLLFILFLFSGLAYAQENPPVIVEEMPRFPGCEDINGTTLEKQRCAERKMLEFIYSTIKYPTTARQNGTEGMVVVSFIVEKDGSLSEIEILRDLGSGCGKESLRVVSEMPDWIPGKDGGELIRVQFNLPVRFKLEGSEYRPPSTTTTVEKKYINVNLRNYGNSKYHVSTPNGWVYLSPKSSKWIKVEEGYQIMYKRRGKEELLVNVNPKLEGREIDVCKTIKKGVLHISTAKH